MEEEAHENEEVNAIVFRMVSGLEVIGFVLEDHGKEIHVIYPAIISPIDHSLLPYSDHTDNGFFKKKYFVFHSYEPNEDILERYKEFVTAVVNSQLETAEDFDPVMADFLRNDKPDVIN